MQIIDLTWRFIRHNDLNEDILVNDADIIEGKSDKEDNESGELKSLIVEMSLNSSTYATIGTISITTFGLVDIALVVVFN